MSNPLASVGCSVRLVATTFPQLGSFPNKGAIASAWQFGPWSDGGAGVTFTKSAAVVSGSNRVFFVSGTNPAEIPPVNYQLDTGTGYASASVVNAIVDARSIAGCRVTSTVSKIFLPPQLGLVSAEVVNAFLAVTGLYIATDTRITAISADVIKTGATVTAGSTSITFPTGTAPAIGTLVIGDGIAEGAYVLSSTATTAVLSAPSTVSGFPNITFGGALTTGAAASADASVTLTIGGHAVVAANSSATGGPGSRTFSPISSFSPNPLSTIRNGDRLIMALPWGVQIGTYSTSFYKIVHGYVAGIDFTLGCRFLLFKDEAGSTPNLDWFADNNPFDGMRLDEPAYCTIHTVADVVFTHEGRIARLNVSEPSLTILGGAIENVELKGQLQVSTPNLRYVTAEEECAGRVIATLQVSEPALTNVMVDLIASIEATLQVSEPRLSGGTTWLRPASLQFESAIAAIIGISPDIFAKVVVSLQVSKPKLTGNEYLQCYLSFASRMAVKLVIETDALNVRQLAGQIMSLWSKSRLELADRAEFRDRFLSDLNAAMQEIYSAAARLNYFNRATESITIAAGESSVTLPFRVQKLLGEVRIASSKRPLWAAGSLSELEQASSLYPGATSPQIYFLDARGQADPQATALTLHVAPAQATGTLVLNCETVQRPPRYSWKDVEDATQVRLPHAYAETLLLPIIRYRASTFRYFFDETKKAEIQAQYQQAGALLGLFEPAPEAAGQPQPNAAPR